MTFLGLNKSSNLAAMVVKHNFVYILLLNNSKDIIALLMIKRIPINT